MNLIFENWRKFQLNEIFNSPLPDSEIDLVIDASWGSVWHFFVDDKVYEMEIKEIGGDDPVLREFEVEFSRLGSYQPTNYGVESGVVVMSTVLKILMDWIQENSNNFFWINSVSHDRNRTRLYNRLLKNITKKLGSDYTSEPFGGLQMLINLGLIEREVDKFIKKSDFKSARKLIADALTALNSEGIKRGKTIQRIVKIFDKVEEAQLGPAETSTDALKRRRAAYNASRGEEQ
jgi:hypothetical protein